MAILLVISTSNRDGNEGRINFYKLSTRDISEKVKIIHVTVKGAKLLTDNR